jgi:hypothetical protein
LVGAALGVAWQVEEVVVVAEILVDFLGQVLDSVFVGNILYHQSCSKIMAQSLQSNHKLVGVEHRGRHRPETVRLSIRLSLIHLHGVVRVTKWLDGAGIAEVLPVVIVVRVRV